MRRRVEIGLLYSREGSYSLVSEDSRQGALAAIADVNGDAAASVELVAVERDPKCNVDLYGPLCADILASSTARHVIGCYTSWSRKEVIPCLERAGGTLWYTAPYEGFEASDHVVYTNACPNQHLLPLLEWTFPRFGRRGYLTGSNYIWGWEINRVARALIIEDGGEVLGERYLPIDDIDVSRMINEIREKRPSFILNSLIGASSYEFLRAYAELGKRDPYFTAPTCPVLSCNLTECEAIPLGEVAEGLISVGPYFSGASGWPYAPGRAFRSSYGASAYAAVRSLAELLCRAPGAEHATLSDLLQTEGDARIQIDRETHHTALPVHIAQIRDGAFRLLQSWDEVAADPYLARRKRPAPAARPILKVVR